jgi:hypothetical protein
VITNYTTRTPLSLECRSYRTELVTSPTTTEQKTRAKSN